MATALRCTLPGCCCECFNPCKTQLRTCQSCQHGWVAHALDKLASKALFPSFQLPGIQTSDVFDMASLLLYGAHAVPIRCKIMLDQLFRALNHADIKHILETLGWDEKHYMAGYMSHDDEGRLRRNWKQTTNEEELIILNQFLRFSQTKSMAEQMISDIQQQKDSKKSMPKMHESNIQAFITNLREKRQSSDLTTSRSVSCTSSDQPMMDYRERVLSPMQASVITQSSNEHSASNPHLGSLSNRISNFPYSEVNPFPHKKMRPSYNYTSPNKDTPRTQQHRTESDHKRTKDRYIAGPVVYRPDVFAPSVCSAPHAPMVCMPSIVTMPSTNTEQFRAPTMGEQFLPRCSVGRDYGPLTSSPAIPHTTTSQYAHIPLPLSLPYKETTCDIKTKLNFPDENVHKDDSTSTEESKNDEESISNDCSMTSANENFQEFDQSMDSSWHMSNSSKRVLCNICQKWFYDKGTWKIHFGAVHLKVKYHCTVEGCNMTFSSIRSRNRHSSNPNPKIHKSEPVHRKAYTRKEYTGKMAMIELSSNTMKPDGTDSEESGDDDAEQSQLGKDNYAYCNPMKYENNAEKESKDGPTRKGTPPGQHHGLASTQTKEFSLSGLPFSKRYMQTLKTEPELNSDESQANKRKSTVPVKYQSPPQDPEDMVDSGTEDEEQCCSDDNNSTASTDHKMEVGQHDLSALTEDIKPVLVVKEPDASIQRIDPASPDHGYGMTGPLPPTPDSSDHCNEGKVSDDFQFNMVSPKEKKDITSTQSSWPVLEPLDQKNQEVLPGGIVVVDHPSTIRKGQGLVCELCSKTYSCKETLKTHYKSIHLGEMHTCTMSGCSAMFPSVRSRNRHSQNVKLHAGLLDLKNHTPSNRLTPNHTHSPNPPLTESIPIY